MYSPMFDTLFLTFIPVVSIRPRQSYPSQKCFCSKRAQDETEFSNQIIFKRSNLFPLQNKANWESHFQNEQGKDECRDKRRGGLVNTREEETKNHTPASQMTNATAIECEPK